MGSHSLVNVFQGNQKMFKVLYTLLFGLKLGYVYPSHSYVLIFGEDMAKTKQGESGLGNSNPVETSSYSLFNQESG